MKRSLITTDDKIESRFFQLPKILFHDYFHDVHIEAKVIYSFLFDRLQLSKKNGWSTEKKELYIYFKVEEVAKMINKSIPTTTKYFNELEKEKLIVRQRQGVNKPNRIFLKSWILNILMSEHKEVLHQDIKNLKAIDTKLMDTELKETELITTSQILCDGVYNFNSLNEASKIVILEYNRIVGHKHRAINKYIDFEYAIDVPPEDWRNIVISYLRSENKPEWQVVDYINKIEHRIINCGYYDDYQFFEDEDFEYIDSLNK
jgi:hypothetical protein